MTISNSFDYAKHAARTALDGVKIASSGSVPDSGVEEYEKLDNRAFDALTKKYGEASVLAYIKTMEAKRMSK